MTIFKNSPHIPKLGLVIVLVGFLFDRAHKAWMLGPYEVGLRGRHSIAPFLDIVLVWNKGISYGLLTQDSPAGRWLLLGIALVGAIIFGVWMWRAGSLIVEAGMGLIVAGALSNGWDRVAYGAVADFFLVHAGGFEWYVFNLADVWIVAGVGMVLVAWATERPEKAEMG